MKYRARVTGGSVACLPACKNARPQSRLLTSRIATSVMRGLHSFLFVALSVVGTGCGREHYLPGKVSKTARDIAPTHVTDANFQTEVLESDKTVLVDMWAPWCQPCIDMKPTIRELAQELAGQVKIVELNVDENPFIQEKYEVDRYPMLLIFIDGVEVERLVGQKSKLELIEALNAVDSAGRFLADQDESQ